MEHMRDNSGYYTGVASEFLVMSTLYRLGIEAFISLGNKKNIDIIIKAKNGSSLTVDVKSVKSYSSIVINNVKSVNNHFIVVVVYNNKFPNIEILPDFYIIPSQKIQKLAENYSGQKRLLKSRIVNYEGKWDYLMV